MSRQNQLVDWSGKQMIKTTGNEWITTRKYLGLAWSLEFNFTQAAWEVIWIPNS